METVSLKALSEKVLQRNQQGNRMETLSFQVRKPGVKKFPLSEVRPDVLLKPDSVSLPATLKDLQTLFEQAVAEVGARYLHGTLEEIRIDYPELNQEMEEAEDRVNELWLWVGRNTRTGTFEGPIDVGTFRGAVDKWKALHMRGIRFFALIEGYTRGLRINFEQSKGQ